MSLFKSKIERLEAKKDVNGLLNVLSTENIKVRNKVKAALISLGDAALNPIFIKLYQAISSIRYSGNKTNQIIDCLKEIILVNGDTAIIKYIEYVENQYANFYNDIEAEILKEFLEPGRIIEIIKEKKGLGCNYLFGALLCHKESGEDFFQELINNEPDIKTIIANSLTNTDDLRIADALITLINKNIELTDIEIIFPFFQKFITNEYSDYLNEIYTELVDYRLENLKLFEIFYSREGSYAINKLLREKSQSISEIFKKPNYEYYGLHITIFRKAAETCIRICESNAEAVDYVLNEQKNCSDDWRYKHKGEYYAIAYILGSIKEKRALKPLIKILENEIDKEHLIYANVAFIIFAIGEIGGDEAFEVLKKYMFKKNYLIDRDEKIALIKAFLNIRQLKPFIEIYDKRNTYKHVTLPLISFFILITHGDPTLLNKILNDTIDECKNKKISPDEGYIKFKAGYLSYKSFDYALLLLPEILKHLRYSPDILNFLISQILFLYGPQIPLKYLKKISEMEDYTKYKNESYTEDLDSIMQRQAQGGPRYMPPEIDFLYRFDVIRDYAKNLIEQRKPNEKQNNII